MNNTIIIGLLVCIVLISFTSIVLSCYTIIRDTKSKESLFQIQMESAKSKSMKDALSVTDLYQIVDGIIKFYTARQLATTNLSQHSEQELSLLLNDVIITITSNVELRLSENFKQMWELYFDQIPTDKEQLPSHLNLYIYENTRLILVRAIEGMKRGKVSDSTSNQKTNSEQKIEQ